MLKFKILFAIGFVFLPVIAGAQVTGGGSGSHAGSCADTIAMSQAENKTPPDLATAASICNKMGGSFDPKGDKGTQCTTPCMTDYGAAEDVCSPLSAVLGTGAGKSADELLAVGAQAANLLTSNPSSSAYGQCGQISDLANSLSEINGAKGTACVAAVQWCTSTCQDEYECLIKGSKGADSAKFLSDQRMGYMHKISDCQGWQKMGIANIQQGLNGLQMQQAAAACQAYYNQQNAQAFNSGVQDCSNPVFASQSTYCICQTNPQDPRCGAGAGHFGSLSAGLPGATNAGSGGTDSSAILGGQDPNFSALSPAKAAAAQPPLGGGSGLGDGKAGAVPPGGEDPTASNPPIASILGNSQGGSGAFSYNGKGDGSATGTGSYLDKLKDKFNLSQLLPNKDKFARGIAGMSVNAVDGITGPNGPSLWEKVSSQYQKKKSGLLP